MVQIIIKFYSLLFLISAFVTFVTAKKELFCIHQTLTAYDKGNGFKLEDIDPSLCTHIVYAYFGITDTGHLISKKPYLDHYNENVIKFNKLKEKNKDLKTLFGVGGWDNELSSKYSNVAADPDKRRIFIRSAIAFIKKYKYNGLALHWCFPGLFGGDPIYDKINFSRWLKEIKEEFKKYDYILMAMVQGTVDNIELSYDVPSINEDVDYIYLTTYDLYGTWRDHIGIHSGLYKSPGTDLNFLNAHFVVQDWIQKGATPEKLIMAIPFFGRTFTLADQNKNEPGAKFTSFGEDGEFMDYSAICESIKDTNNWVTKWESTTMGPYSYKNKLWVGYDNIQSIEIKVNYIEKYKLGGAAAIFIEDDDFKGICDDIKYPLLTTLYKNLNSMPKDKNKIKSKYHININLQKINSTTNENIAMILNHNEKFEL